jgi:hypothetical protein
MCLSTESTTPASQQMQNRKRKPQNANRRAASGLPAILHFAFCIFCFAMPPVPDLHPQTHRRKGTPFYPGPLPQSKDREQEAID